MKKNLNITSMLILAIMLSSCALADNPLPDSYFSCQHKHTQKRSFIVESPIHDIRNIRPDTCSDIIKQNGECPSFVEIKTLNQDILYFNKDEINNYTCNYNEKKSNEIK